MKDMRIVSTRRYRFSAESKDGLHDVTDRIVALQADYLYLSATSKIESDPDKRFEFSDITSWREFVDEHWDELLEAAIYTNLKPNNDISVLYDLEEGSARIKVAGPAAFDVDRIFADLEEALACPKLDDASSRGIRRHYFVNTPVTPGWIDGLVEIIQNEVGKRASFDARLRIAGAQFTEHVFQDVKSWRSELEQSWSHLQSVYLWTRRKGFKISFDCDIRRQLLRLETTAPTYGEAMTLLSAMETRLDLEEAPENPYKYRKFARFYDIKKWKENAAFASAVKLAVEKGFLTQPVFVNGHITQGGSTQDLEAGNDLETFMKRLGDNGFLYDGAQLYLEGPRGAALGINLDLTKKSLNIRSSLDRQKTTQVADIFENAIDLKLTKDTTSGAEVERRTSSGLDLFTKIVVPMALAFLSVEFIKAAVPQDSLEITFPRPRADEVAVLNADSVRPHWIVRRTRWWDTKDRAYPPSATLQILDSEGKEVLNMKGVHPGHQINLQPGAYQLGVAIPELGKSVRMRLEITRIKSPSKSR